MHPRARPAHHGVERIDDVPYRRSGLPEHQLDIYRPHNADGAPVVFYVHGGGFRFMNRRTHWMMGLGFARRGYITVSVDYRLAPEHPCPAAVVDVCNAYRWVCRCIGDYGGDPSRIIVAGESAGANLALSLAVAACIKRPEAWMRRVFDCGHIPTAALLACGIYEVNRPHRFRKKFEHLPDWLYFRIAEVYRDYLHRSPVRQKACCQLADPLCLLENLNSPDRPLPPVFAPCGKRDPLLDDTRRLERALRHLDSTVEAPCYPGEPHAFHAMLWKETALDCWRDTYSFLDEHVPPQHPAPDSYS